MTRNELLEYSISMSSLCEKLLNIEERLTVLEGEWDVQKRVNELLKKRSDKVEQSLITAEKTISNNAQYLRRRQLEISNVPIDIASPDLTKTITAFLNITGEVIKEEDIDKCHRLKKNTTVIMEFKTRQVRDGILMARSKLKDKKKEAEKVGLGKSFINESLCYEYRHLDYICRRLKKSEKVKDTWFFNGKLFVVDFDGTKHLIKHITDTYKFSSVEAIDAYTKRP